jgi:hypothetical protein
MCAHTKSNLGNITLPISVRLWRENLCNNPAVDISLLEGTQASDKGNDKQEECIVGW